MTASLSEDTNAQRATHQTVGRILGPLLFILMLLIEDAQTAMSTDAWRVAAAGIWMAVWWATEAIPVAVTAFLPLVIFEPLGVSSIRDAAALYAHPTIFLFMGGFMLALAIERSGLHRRISLAVLDKTGTDGRRLVGGFMGVGALLSMWMANTSTTLMLLPIVISVVKVMRENVVDADAKTMDNFEIVMLLGVAYACSIGGLATLVGTPPNALLIAYMAENYALDISFARWMMVGVPVTIVMLPLAWLILTHFVFPVELPANRAVDEHLKDLRAELGPMSTAERRIAVTFGIVVFCWMLRRPITEFLGISGVSDTGIVMAAAIALFLIPSGNAEQPRLMDWADTSRLPWGVLILFGGGLSLAAVVSSSGLALWLGESLAPLNAFGTVVLVFAAVALVIYMTELTSNLATTAALLPVMGAIAVQAGVPPIVLTVPITVAASCAFMLPVATPPNAIVFATGAISIPQMVKAGFMLNLIGVVVVSIVSIFLAPQLLQ